MTEIAVRSPSSAGWIRGLDVTAKAGLLVLLATAFVDSDLGHLRDKAAALRAVTYPMLAFSLPTLWLVFWRDRPFPWLADFLITVTCFSDILGNRMDLYDTHVWFDDWMHFANTGLLTAAFILLTLRSSASLGATLERALAFGVTAAVGWEIAEYFAFLHSSAELPNAYADTLGDIAIGTIGALLAGLSVHALRRAARIHEDQPLFVH